MRVDFWVVEHLATGAHPEDSGYIDWPSSVESQDYEPVGPWEPITMSSGYEILWRRPYRKKESDLELLSDAALAASDEDLVELERMARGVLTLIDDLRSIRKVLER